MENKKFNKIISNLIYAFTAQFISLFLSIVMSLVVPKMLGVEEYAYWQLFIFYSTYVGFFHFGLSDGIYLRYGGVEYKDMDKRLIGSQLWLMIIWQSLISIVLTIVTINVINDKQRLFVWIVTAIYLVCANTTWFLGYVFQAANQTRVYSISVIISKVAFIISIFILMILHQDKFQIFVILFVITQIVAMSYCIVVGRDIIFVKLLPFREIISATMQNIKSGINLTLSNISSSLIVGFGRMIVDSVWGISAFGIFSLSISLTNFFLQFISQVSMVLFPALRKVDNDELNKIYKSIRDILSIVLPMILLIYMPLSHILIAWLPNYATSFRYMSFLIPLCTYDGKMNLLCNTYFKVLRKEKLLLGINIVSMFLSGVFSLFGAYIFNSMYFIVFGMVFAVAFRSVVSELYLAKIMNTSILKEIILETILVILFIILVSCFNKWSTYSLFIILYIIYIIYNKSKLNTFIKMLKIFKGKINS